MKKKNVKKAPQKKAVKTKENTVTKSKLPAKKKVIIKRKSATRSMSFESVTGLHQEIIAVKAKYRAFRLKEAFRIWNSTWFSLMI